MSMDPVNYRRRSAADLERDAEYALTTLETFQTVLQRCGAPLQGLNLVELGPGSDFAAQLILASMGAQVTLVDRFLSRWDPDYHPRLYTLVSERWSGPKGELEKVIRAGTHAASSLCLLEEQAEAMRGIPDGSVDLVYSNAVLEHIVDMGRVASEIARVSKPGAWSVHQIDWRDHRNFNRPLEHLLMPDDIFVAAAEAVHYEFGNRLRSIEYWAHFEAAGFEVEHREVNNVADSDYFAEALQRIRACRSSYRNWPEDDLKRISGRFYLRRHGDVSEAGDATERGRDMELLISALKQSTLDAARETNVEEEHIEFVLSKDTIQPEQGYAWQVPLPDLPGGDTSDDSWSSKVVLLEDGKPLGPAHTLHERIRREGKGRFSHWETTLYFSSSDNASPLDTDRCYSVRVPTSWIALSGSGD